ncbi:MAG: hypothetical protein MMC23_005697 [Stictis urceolatum]|nr:hypothetical protein [Stictis urceolata]
MSVTTTQNTCTYSIVRTLADYELHHSAEEDPDQAYDPEANRHPTPSSQPAENPRGWETEFRRVPQFRATNYDLEFESRNKYQNNIERFFIINMFGGIMMVQD